MLQKFKTRGTALVATVALLGGTAWIAAGSTGAYFSDTNVGDITGTIGSIQVDTSGGGGADHANLRFDRLLPGEPQTVTVNYLNSGDSAEDVWIVFNNATALSAFNNIGRWGEASLSANGTELFHSANLNDRIETCGSIDITGCWPLASKYKVASAVEPGAGGYVSFTFAYAATTVTPPPIFNHYPASLKQYSETLNKADQETVNAADGVGNGLPYQIVATQKNQQP